VPFFTLQISPSGPVVDAIVAVSQAKRVALTAANQAIPAHQVIRALVDTGASCTCIDPTVLNALGLVATGSAVVNTPTTGTQPQIVSTFDISLTIPLTNFAPFVLETLEVVESQLLAAQGFHALIGRDALRHCHFVYNGRTQIFTLGY
jgi:predicted aspartyl protease